MPVKQISHEMQEFAVAVGKAETWKEKREVLAYARNIPIFMKVIDLAFNPDITFSRLPEELPPHFKPEYTGEAEGLLKNFLMREKYVYFIDQIPDNANIRQHKLDLMYLNCVEALPTDDRAFLLSIFAKNFIFPEITYELVWDTFREFTFNWELPTTSERGFEDEAEEDEEEVAPKQQVEFPELVLPGMPPVKVPDVDLSVEKKEKKKYPRKPVAAKAKAKTTKPTTKTSKTPVKKAKAKKES